MNLSHEKLYPVFALDHLQFLYYIFKEDESAQLYTREIWGIPICAYDLEARDYLSISEFEYRNSEIYTFDEICDMQNILYNLYKYREDLSNDPAYEDYVLRCLNKGYDIREVYAAKLCASVFIFYGAEIIFCKKYIKEIADELNDDLYLYLNRVDYLTLLPKRAIVAENGIINLFPEINDIESRSSLSQKYEFCNKFFYYSREKDECKEIISEYRKIKFEL